MGRSRQVSVADLFVQRLSSDVDRFEEAGRTLSQEGAGGVHQLRVACRRLRGDLHLFRHFLQPDQTQRLREDLKELASELGPARDLKVHRQRIAAVAADESTPEDLLPSIAEVDKLLAAREKRAIARACAVVDNGKYKAVRTRLRRAVRVPPTTDAAQQSAAEVFPELLYAVWRPMHRMLSRLADDADAADDETWHRARIRAKQTRYAAECAEPTLGEPAEQLAAAAKSLQDHLGRHQDAVVAARTVSDLAAKQNVRPSTAEAARWLADHENVEITGSRSHLKPVKQAQQDARKAAKALKRGS